MEERQYRMPRRAVAAIAAGFLVLAACGGDDDDSETTAAAADTTAAAPDTTEAAPETTEAAPETTEAAPETTEAAPETTEAAETTESAETSAAAGGENGVIGFSYGADDSEIYPVVLNPALEEAEVRGYTLLEGAAASDCDKQVQDVEGFVEQGVDAIVLLPLCGPEPVANVVQQAVDAGIVVVGYSTEIEGGDAAILYDNVGMGTQLGDEAVRWFNEDFTGDEFTWGLFTFDSCGTACTDRTDTVRQIVTEGTGVEPLEAEAIAIDTGLEATETWLQSDPGLDMVLGINDAGALGAYQAFIASDADLANVFVGGMDGQKEAIELIVDGGGDGGIYRASSALVIADIGRAVVDVPADILEGNTTQSLLLNGVLLTPADPETAQQILDTF